MKLTMKLFALLFSVLMLANAAYAESPREQLKQMVEQLQKNPTDNVLREKIIKLAQKMKPAPAIPEEARRSFVEGNTITRTAKDAKEQLLAVESFKEALKIAPWWGDAYYNLAVAQELAEQLDDSGKSLQFYLLTNPGAKEAREAQDRIYALNAKKKLAVQEQTAKANEKAAEEAKYGWLLGQWEGRECLNMPKYNANTCTDPRTSGRSGFGIVNAVKNGNTIILSSTQGSYAGAPGEFLRAIIDESGGFKWEERHQNNPQLTCPGDGSWNAISPTISPDKQTIYFERIMLFAAPNCNNSGDILQVTLKRQ